MKNIKNILLTFSIILLTIGCEELEFGDKSLEKPSGNDVTIDTVYSNIMNAEYALNAAYRTLPYRLPYGWGVTSNVMNQEVTESLTDLCQSYMGWGGAIRYYYSTTMDASMMNWVSHSRFHFSKENSWLGIRRAWTFIENIDRVPDASDELKIKLKAEAKMVIAHHYTELYRSYGGLPWVTKSFTPGDDTFTPRMTAEATRDSIVSLCDQAAEYLPWTLEELSNDEGHYTKASAMGLKVRVLLFGASPLFNSDQPFRAGQAADEKMTWYGKYDRNHWLKVIEACEDFEKMNAIGGYALVNTGNPRDDFKSGYYDRGTNETLISVRHFYKNWTSMNFYTYCNQGVARPTQELVDLYPMTNGLDITDDNSGFDANDPYVDRDPRLYETVIVQGDNFRGSPVDFSPEGQTKLKNQGMLAEGYATGYMLRKFYLDGDAATSGNSVAQWPYLRLPEIYLSYAEALNEYNEGPTPLAYEYLNKTRERVGVEPVTKSLSQEEFRAEVLRERAREFCMEEVRWYDLRRWKLPFIQPHKMEITKKDDGSLNYEVKPTTQFKRLWVTNWDAKWYLAPFPSNEINKGYGLIQNPGWE